VRAAAVLVAAGRSTRMAGAGGDRKPFLVLGGRSILEHTCDAFDRAETIAAIVIVGHPEDLPRLRELAGAAPALRKVRAVVPGGAERSDSVRAGVAAVPADTELVAVHDAARALVRPETIDAAVRTASERGGALVALPVRDTIKESEDGAAAARTLDRARLWAAQTPQVFRRADLFEWHERAAAEGFSPTDDAALCERYRGPVPLVPGAAANMKITTPEDLAIAAAILALREEER